MKQKMLFVILISISTLFAEKTTLSEIRISLLSEATAFPSYKLIRLPIHPGFSVGINLLEKSKKRHEHALVIEGAYFYDEIAGHCIMLYPEYDFEFFWWKIMITTDIGLGYKHNIFARPVYKKIDGKYKQVTDWGTPQLMLPIGLGLGFKLPKEYNLFIRYRWIAAFPFCIKGGLPLMSHTTFNIGVTIPLKNKGKI
jgi:hypothetical protein